MNEEEFWKTLIVALEYVCVEPSYQEVQEIFKVLNTSKNGWVSYETYYVFLHEYFGYVNGEKNRGEEEIEEERYFESLTKLPPMERVKKMIRYQIRKHFLKYDDRKDFLFFPNEIEEILKKVFFLT